MPAVTTDLIREYIEFTRTTAVYPGALKSGNEELSYLTLGLADEWGEVMEVLYFPGDLPDPHVPGKRLSYNSNKYNDALKKEIGDVCYYLFRIFDCLRIQELDALWDTKSACANAYVDNVQVITITISKVAGRAKKALRDGKKYLEIGEDREEMRSYLGRLSQWLRAFTMKQGLDFEDILRINMEKLQKRKDENKLQGDGNSR